MMKTNDKKGITLIALVITIIVLLILAGVSIATLAEIIV
ncbi:MAG: prepilin-type N-terminal cleavage/methylation domain-containing protein [Clostridia bacterium]